MKNTLKIIAIIAITAMIGCVSLSPEARIIGKIVLRRAVFELVQTNPSLRVAITAMSATLKVLDDTTPAGVDRELQSALDGLDVSTRDRQDLRDIKDLVVAGYSNVYPKIETKTEDALTVVKAMSDALSEGVSEVPASGEKRILVSGGIIVIE